MPANLRFFKSYLPFVEIGQTGNISRSHLLLALDYEVA
jgi:hypothetical protein